MTFHGLTGQASLQFCRPLGAAVLETDEELDSAYKDILSSSCSPQEILRRCVEIFQMGLDLDVHPDSRDPFQDQEPDKYQPDMKACRYALMAAWQEGKIMQQQSDYHFVRVFAFLAWIGLQCDPDWLCQFETVCVSYKDDPKEIVKRGRDILKDALFRRRPPDRIHLSDN